MASGRSIHQHLEWNSEPAWVLPDWGEPVMVAGILVATMILTRRRGYRIFDKNRKKRYGLLTTEPWLQPSEDISFSDTDSCDGEDISTTRHLLKKRRCCFATFHVPDTSRFAENYHSRILQRFPFLIEMFYWIITYTFYRCTSLLSESIFSKTGIWNVAQDHGLAILEFEQFSSLSFLWPISELEVQQWFMNKHQMFLTVLNRSYALVHIPGSVGFIAWWYCVAPSHDTFAAFRRTLTLTNFIAFLIFICYPSMPPRLLPQEYGFLDTVRHDNAQSVWMEGKYVNALAAMPSMHFGYSFCIGCTIMYYSGIGRKMLESGETRKWKSWALLYAIGAIAYPSWTLLTIIATANHYYLDAIAGALVVVVSFFCNCMLIGLLPLEDLLFWCLRLDKPVPTTGAKFLRR